MLVVKLVAYERGHKNSFDCTMLSLRPALTDANNLFRQLKIKATSVLTDIVVLLLY